MRALPLVRWLAQVVTRLFYSVDRAGQVPPSGAVLLLANHANALLDPAIVWATAGRDIRFLAKSTLFNGPLAAVLRAAGAIPVHRRSDASADPSRNAEAFEAVHRALAAGDAICIFPEGISHSTGRLEPLRTGAARMAIAAERGGVSVQLVAVGLNFDRKTAFRSDVAVVFGRPFSARDLTTQEDRAAVALLTDRIADQMRRLIVEADPEADDEIVRRVEHLYSAARGRPRTVEERVRRRQTVAIGIQRLRSEDPSRFRDIAMRLRKYDQRLRQFGLRDAHLDWDLSTRAAVVFTIRETLAGIALAPIAFAGVVIFWVPYRLTDRLAGGATEHRDVTATAKVFVGAAVYLLWLALVSAGVGWAFGARAGFIVLVFLPFLAIAGLYAVDREAAAIDTARSWVAMRRASTRSRDWLKRTRSDITELLDQVYEWLSAEPSGQEAGRKLR